MAMSKRKTKIKEKMRQLIEKVGGELTGSRLYGIVKGDSDWDFDISLSDAKENLEFLRALGFNIEELPNLKESEDYNYSDVTLHSSYKSVLNNVTYNLLIVHDSYMEARRYFRTFMLNQTQEFIYNFYSLDKVERALFFTSIIHVSIYITNAIEERKKEAPF